MREREAGESESKRRGNDRGGEGEEGEEGEEEGE